MTKQEFDEIVSEQKEKGLSEEDIVKAFAIMFREGTIDRKGFEACLDALGYELTGELKDATDEELKEKVLENGDKPAPEADEKPADGKKDEEPEDKKPGEKSDEVDEEEEKKETFKKFGIAE